jgi:hypothetical protein
MLISNSRSLRLSETRILFKFQQFEKIEWVEFELIRCKYFPSTDNDHKQILFYTFEAAEFK